jgi:hypothetical protein
MESSNPPEIGAAGGSGETSLSDTLRREIRFVELMVDTIQAIWQQIQSLTAMTIVDRVRC